MKLVPCMELVLSNDRLNMVSKLICSWLITSILCSSTVYSTLDKFCSVSDSYHISSQGICGEKLSDILQLLCGMGGYHKRSLQGAILQDQPLPSDKTSPDKVSSDLHSLNNAFLSKSDASSFLLSKRSKWDELYGSVVNDGHFKQGIVCECCQNRCSVGELMQYCRRPSVSSLAKRFWKTTLSPSPTEKVKEENKQETHKHLTQNAAEKSELNKGGIVNEGNT